MRMSDFEPEHIIAFLIYAAVMSFAGARICGKDHDAFEEYAPLFIWLPAFAGVAGTFGVNPTAGMIACGLSALTLTATLGRLSLRSCLIFTATSPLIMFISSWLGAAVVSSIWGL